MSEIFRTTFCALCQHRTGSSSVVSFSKDNKGLCVYPVFGLFCYFIWHEHQLEGTIIPSKTERRVNKTTQYLMWREFDYVDSPSLNCRVTMPCHMSIVSSHQQGLIQDQISITEPWTRGGLAATAPPSRGRRADKYYLIPLSRDSSGARLCANAAPNCQKGTPFSALLSTACAIVINKKTK